MRDGGARFEVACLHCVMRLAVDRIGDAEARAMGNHLRERHPELGLGETATLGEVFEHFRVTPIQR